VETLLELEAAFTKWKVSKISMVRAGFHPTAWHCQATTHDGTIFVGIAPTWIRALEAAAQALATGVHSVALA